MKYLVVLIILLFFSCSKTSNEISGEEFEKFKTSFLNDFYELNPGYASYLGLKVYDSILVLPTKENDSLHIAAYQTFQKEVNAFDEGLLELDHRIELQLIKNHIEQSLWYRTLLKSSEWDPSRYNIGYRVGEVFADRDREMNDKLRVIQSYLKDVPEYYALARSLLDHPTKEHCQLAVIQLNGAVNTMRTVADSARESTLADDEKSSFLERMAQAETAINSYVNFLNSLLAEKDDDYFSSFRIGKKLYDQKYKLDINSGYTADEIYQTALRRKEYVLVKMDSLASLLWTKYLGDLPQPNSNYRSKKIKMVIDTLSVNHAESQYFIAEIEAQISELEAFVSAKDLLTLDPEKPLRVRPTPEYQRGVSVASINAPGPFEKNADTYYNVSPIDDYSPEIAESHLREYNDYILQILNIHEAIPGHYAQLVYSNQSESLVKSIFSNGSTVEGWAVYSELMMLENGYKDTPEMWLMYYKWHLRTIANTILDYSVHVLNMSREEGLNLMINEAFQQQEEAEGKWRRATYTQVQLTSYYSGFQEIYDLREELKVKMGDEFDLKEFHEKILSYGSIPVRFIRELMLEDL